MPGTAGSRGGSRLRCSVVAMCVRSACTRAFSTAIAGAPAELLGELEVGRAQRPAGVGRSRARCRRSSGRRRRSGTISDRPQAGGPDDVAAGVVACHGVEPGLVHSGEQPRAAVADDAGGAVGAAQVERDAERVELGARAPRSRRAPGAAGARARRARRRSTSPRARGRSPPPPGRASRRRRARSTAACSRRRGSAGGARRGAPR